MSNRTSYHDFDQLIQEARMQRTAAIGNAIAGFASAIGAGLKSAFGSDEKSRQAISKVKLRPFAKG